MFANFIHIYLIFKRTVDAPILHADAKFYLDVLKTVKVMAFLRKTVKNYNAMPVNF